MDTSSLLDREEDIIIHLKDRLDRLVGCVSETMSLQQMFYLEKINKLIEFLETQIEDLVVDVSSNPSKILTKETVEEMKQYIINERVKETFLPYMMVYSMYLNEKLQ